MKFNIELDAQQGLRVSGHISPLALRVLLTAGVGASIPWLVQLGQMLGWL